MLEEGRYKAKAIEAALGVAGTGTEQVGVAFEITEGPAKGYEITWYGHFTPKALERTLESLRYCGWEGDDITDLRGIGKSEVQLVIEHEEKNDGTMQARVKWVNRSGGLAMKERMNAGQAAGLAKRIKGAAVASRQKLSANEKPPQHRRTEAPSRRTGTDNMPDAGDDDIPF